MKLNTITKSVLILTASLFISFALYFIFSKQINHIYYVISNELFQFHYERNKEDNRVALAVLNPKGEWLAMDIVIDTLNFGWLPMMFVLSLVIATPIQLNRKYKSLILGFLIVNLFVSLKFELAVLKYDDELFALEILPGFFLWQVNLSATILVLKMEVASSLIISVLICLVVAIRQGDLESFIENKQVKKS